MSHHENLFAGFALSAAKEPRKPALFFGDQEWNYQSLFRGALAAGQRISEEFQIAPGDRVGLWLKNCPEFIPATFGVLAAGGVVVPINNFLKPEEVDYIIKDAGIKVLISEEAMFEGLKALQPGLKFLNAADLLAPGTAERKEVNFSPVSRKPSDLAVIIYTSGTTGRPKGAMLSHGNLLHNVESCRVMLEAVSLDRFVVILPMFHSFMLTVCVLLPLIVGGSIVLVKSLHPPKNILQEIIARQATILPAIPQFFRALAAGPVPPQFPLRLCISGAAPLPGEILKEFNAKFPIPLLEGYGLSEASPVVSLNPIRGIAKPGSIGVPVSGVEVSVQDEEGNVLGPGAVGEICVRGGNVMQGYWNQPEETSRALRNGWLLTGDVGYGDADGYYFITDRKKDMLLVNGINVYPREIEEIIYQFPGIKEAAVISKPDPRKGEQPIAYVSLNENATAEESAIIGFVRSKLADYKVPRRVHFLPQLPRNATGKILKTELRKLG